MLRAFPGGELCGGGGGQKEFEMERTMTEAELSCRAQAIRGESCIVQSSIEVSFSANYPNDKNDYSRVKVIDFEIVPINVYFCKFYHPNFI